MKKILSLFFVLAVFLLAAGDCFAGGLTSHFIEVKLDNVKPGETYSIKAKTGLPIDIVNTTDGITFDIKIEPQMPKAGNIVPGYDPIGDLSWVKIEKDSFEKVEPGKTIETDANIVVPDQPENYGRKYQVYIYSHTVGGSNFRFGLMGRVLIQTVEKPA